MSVNVINTPHYVISLRFEIIGFIEEDISHAFSQTNEPGEIENERQARAKNGY